MNHGRLDVLFLRRSVLYNLWKDIPGHIKDRKTIGGLRPRMPKTAKKCCPEWLIAVYGTVRALLVTAEPPAEVTSNDFLVRLTMPNYRDLQQVLQNLQLVPSSTTARFDQSIKSGL